MKADINKEQWINEVMNSLEGITPAQPDDGLFERITEKLRKPQTTKIMNPYPAQWAAAAILLLALNIGSVVYFASRHHQNTAASAANPLSAEILSESTYNY
jgi:hypothetical protein